MASQIQHKKLYKPNDNTRAWFQNTWQEHIGHLLLDKRSCQEYFKSVKPTIFCVGSTRGLICIKQLKDVGK